MWAPSFLDVSLDEPKMPLKGSTVTSDVPDTGMLLVVGSWEQLVSRVEARLLWAWFVTPRLNSLGEADFTFCENVLEGGWHVTP